MRFWPMATMAIALAGCISNTETQQKLATSWVGKPADAFFIKNGPPATTYRLDSGGAIHIWAGGQKSYQMAGSSTGAISPSFGGGYSVTTTTTPATTLNIECQARITTDPKGVIVDLSLSKDTIGAWQLSRCNELFA